MGRRRQSDRGGAALEIEGRGMRLYVGNLPYETSERELRDIFCAHGHVIETQIIRDRQSGRSKGFGFVELEDGTSAAAIIGALDNAELGGRRMRVSRANPKSAR